MIYQIYITILLTAIIIWSGYFIGTKTGMHEYADNFVEEYILPTVFGILIIAVVGLLLSIIVVGSYTIIGLLFFN